MVLATTQQWSALDPLEAALLAHLLPAITPTGMSDVPIYLPLSSPATPVRLLVAELSPGRFLRLALPAGLPNGRQKDCHPNTMLEIGLEGGSGCQRAALLAHMLLASSPARRIHSSSLCSNSLRTHTDTSRDPAPPLSPPPPPPPPPAASNAGRFPAYAIACRHAPFTTMVYSRSSREQSVSILRLSSDRHESCFYDAVWGPDHVLLGSASTTISGAALAQFVGRDWQN